MIVAAVRRRALHDQGALRQMRQQCMCVVLASAIRLERDGDGFVLRVDEDGRYLG